MFTWYTYVLVYIYDGHIFVCMYDIERNRGKYTQ
jgi:hypothetical protein